MRDRIGFMQGRLCDQVDGKIQAFPWDSWRDEFPAARDLDIPLMEWTLDQERLHENPFMTLAGQTAIRDLCSRHGLAIPSVTGDCFMQAPYYKAATPAVERELLSDFAAIVTSCAALGVRYIVFPLVDAGRIENASQESRLREGLNKIAPLARQLRVKIIFESDLPPPLLRQFIASLERDVFGINYDIGNSAALGFSPAEEFAAYGDFVDNVHVKDRVLGGTTVPLGTGNADLAGVFKILKRRGYAGNFILQTARAKERDHAAVLSRYREMTLSWWEAA